MNVTGVSSVALNVTEFTIGASFTAATLMVAELGVVVVPSDILKFKDAAPLKLAAGV